MKTPEQNLWERIKNNMTAYPDIHMERNENIVGNGFPDTIAIVGGIVTFLELKQVPDFPAREKSIVIGNDKGLSQDQKNWHLNWTQYSGRVATLVGVDSYFYFLVSARYSDRINEFNRRDLAYYSMACGKQSLFWPRLANSLRMLEWNDPQ